MKAAIISTFGREYIPPSRTEFGAPYKEGGKWNIYVYVRRFEIEVSAWTFSELEEKLRFVSPLKAAQRVYDSLSIADQITFGDRPSSYEDDFVEVIPTAPVKRDETAKEIRALRRDLRNMAEAIGEGMNEALEAQRSTVPTMPTITQSQKPQPQAPVQPDPMQQLQMENAQLQQQLAGMSQAMQRLTEQMAYMQGQIDAGKPKAESEPPKK